MSDKRTESQFPEDQVIFRKGNEGDTKELQRRSREASKAEQSLSDEQKRERGTLLYPENVHIPRGFTSSVRNVYGEWNSRDKRVNMKVQTLSDVPISGRSVAEAERREKVKVERKKQQGAGIIKAGKLREGK